MIRIECAHDAVVPLGDLKPNPANPNKHPEAQIKLLAKIIKAQGWRNPIVVSNCSGLITKGHARLEAAKLIGTDTAPVDYQDYGSEHEELADMIADNRIAELAEPDRSMLRELAEQLDDGAFDMGLTGFDSLALEELMTAAPPESDIDAEPQIDKAEELRKKWKVERGQIWQLSEHKIMCGDSTSRPDVEKLMGSTLAHLIFTDPPYGVDYDGGTTVRQKLDGDKDTSLYEPCCATSRDFSDKAAPLYLWHAGVKGIAAAAAAAAAAAGYQIRCELVWNKNQAQYGALSAQYKQKHEPCYYCFRKGSTPRWFGPTNEITVWDIDRASVNNFHPTQKPTELAARAIRNSSKSGQIVADWFLGSGSTLIACEQLGRKCRAMEIDPGYVAVSIQRWADATGKTPVVISDTSSPKRHKVPRGTKSSKK